MTRPKSSQAKGPAKGMTVCPQCGATFPRRRSACPECGSDERTGWKSQEDIDYESVDLPEDLTDYLPPGEAHLASRRRPKAIVWLVAAILAIVAMLIVTFT